MKRIVLFLATNIAILMVLSVIVHVFNLDQALARQGFSVTGLLAFAAVMGFGGAFISLAISKWMAKRSMGVRVIGEPRNESERWLLSVVRNQAQVKGIGMPEVGIFDSPEPNAFATGARRDSSLVAVSSGLLQRMSPKEVEAVLAHEMSHVANGDMVTLTLVQGVVNTFVFFLARVIGTLVDRSTRSSDDRSGGYGPAYFITRVVRAARARRAREHDRHVVLASARIPGGLRQRQRRRQAAHDRRARKPQGRASSSAFAIQGLRHRLRAETRAASRGCS